MKRNLARRIFLKQSVLTSLVAALSRTGIGAFALDKQTPQPTVDEKVNALIARMTLEEKIQMVHGVRRRGLIGYVPAIPRLGIPELSLTDGPAGVRHGPGTAFPAPVAVAATWDRSLAQQYGAALGAETKAKGQDGPVSVSGQ